MSISDEILIIANKIANQGKKPSIALIKTKLSTSVPLPVIISTLKNWQHEPDFISLKNEVPVAMKIKDRVFYADDENLAIEKALIPFKQEIIALRLEVDEIKKHLEKTC